MASSIRLWWLALGLAPALALAEPRGSLEVGVTALSQTLTGEVRGGDEVYDFVPSEAGYGLAFGVEWPFGATVQLGAELWLGLFDVATGGLNINGPQFEVHLGPRLRLAFPVGHGLFVEGLVGLAPGYVTAPSKGSLTLSSRIGAGLGHGITDETAVVVGASHVAVAAWPAEALFDDITVIEPRFVGLSALLLTVGVRGLP